VWHARSDLYLVLANVGVLFDLVMMRPSRARDGATESMLVVARLGAAVECQGAIGDHPGAVGNR
jgi:hypothetical protein